MTVTSRGFTAPSILPENLRHVRERFLVVRMTDWEYECQRDNRELFNLLPREDGTFDAVRPWSSWSFSYTQELLRTAHELIQHGLADQNGTVTLGKIPRTDLVAVRREDYERLMGAMEGDSP